MKKKIILLFIILLIFLLFFCNSSFAISDNLGNEIFTDEEFSNFVKEKCEDFPYIFMYKKESSSYYTFFCSNCEFTYDVASSNLNICKNYYWVSGLISFDISPMYNYFSVSSISTGKVDMYYCNYDVKDKDGNVVFRKPPIVKYTIPKIQETTQLAEVIMGVVKVINPVGLVVLLVVLLISLIRWVILRMK